MNIERIEAWSIDFSPSAVDKKSLKILEREAEALGISDSCDAADLMGLSDRLIDEGYKDLADEIRECAYQVGEDDLIVINWGDE